MSWAHRVARRVPGVARWTGREDPGSAVDRLRSDTDRIDATVRDAVDDLSARIAALERRIAAVERDGDPS